LLAELVLGRWTEVLLYMLRFDLRTEIGDFYDKVALVFFLFDSFGLIIKLNFILEMFLV
jgi:hypothetical protein